MAKSASTLAKELTAMAASIAYLNDMEAVVRKKPVFPKAVQASMGAAVAEMESLLNHFNLVRAQAAQCADPVVNEYLAVAIKKGIGDMVSGKLSYRGRAWGSGSGASTVVTFKGLLSKAAIWLPALAQPRGVRSLYYMLQPAAIEFNGRDVRTVRDFEVARTSVGYDVPLSAIDGPDGIIVVYACPLNETPILE